VERVKNAIVDVSAGAIRWNWRMINQGQSLGSNCLPEEGDCWIDLCDGAFARIAYDDVCIQRWPKDRAHVVARRKGPPKALWRSLMFREAPFPKMKEGQGCTAVQLELIPSGLLFIVHVTS